MSFSKILAAIALLALTTPGMLHAVTPLVSWEGYTTPWEAGTETLDEENRVIPIVNFTSQLNASIVSYRFDADGGSNEEFLEIPGSFPFPSRDAGITGIIDQNGYPWVEHYPVQDHIFAPIADLDTAKWFIDYRGIRGNGERKQWILTENTEGDSTCLVQVSLGTPTTIATFEGTVETEPLLYESRGSDLVGDVYLYPVWSNSAQNGLTVYNRAEGELEELDFPSSEPFTPVCMTFVPDRNRTDLGTIYFIERDEGNDYKLIHYVNGVSYERLSFTSTHLPEKLISPFYEPSGSFSPDFLTWLTCDGDQNYIHWARITYTGNFETPDIIHDSLLVEDPVTKLRAHYLWDQDNTGFFDSWYVSYSVYNETNNTSYLKYHFAGRNPDNSTSVFGNNDAIPSTITVSNAYPNPFNASSRLSFDLQKAGHILTSVYNLNGQRVATLSDKVYQPGRHTVTINRQTLPSGTYFIQVIGNGALQSTQKITLLK